MLKNRVMKLLNLYILIVENLSLSVCLKLEKGQREELNELTQNF
jgi:hypothetical protein